MTMHHRFDLLILALSVAAIAPVRAGSNDPYPNMAPVGQYLMNQADEIAMARSAGPASISGAAEILVLGTHGYETRVKGSNGFVCYVSRAWDNDFSNSDFWNPKVRGPICANPATVRSVLPYIRQRAEWVLAGVPKAEIVARTKAAIAAKQLTAPEAGAMSFMLSKDGYLGDQAKGPWAPHVMFWGPPGPGSNWGADLPGSPVFSDAADVMPFTMYFIPVRKWSDGTLAESGHGH
jgi:hypothetical protein